VERLGLSPKLLLTLKEAGIGTFDELKNCSPRQLARLPGVGRVHLAALRSALHPYDAERVAVLERRIGDHQRAIEALKREIEQVKNEGLIEPGSSPCHDQSLG
jgi:DNA repair protein RadC